MKTKQQSLSLLVCVCVRARTLASEDEVSRRFSKRMGEIEEGYRFHLFTHPDPFVKYWRMKEEVY